jgi:hypothetical protein
MKPLLLSSILVSLVTSVGAVLVLRMVSRTVRLKLGHFLLPMNVVSGWSLLLLGAVFVLIAFTFFVVRVRAAG